MSDLGSDNVASAVVPPVAPQAPGQLAYSIRPITAEQALTDYNKLRLHTGTTAHLFGQKAVDFHTFKHRICASNSTGVSFYTSFVSGEFEPCKRRFIDERLSAKMSIEKLAYHVNSLYAKSKGGVLSNFRATIAQSIYRQFSPTCILDPCAGWGSRALAALACDINYIGFDTNTALKPAYDEMAAMYPSSGRLTMRFEDSAIADMSGLVYDMVLTSPPYWTRSKLTEIYEGMPEHASKEEFNNKFLFPMLRRVWDGLSLGGTFAINVPVQMYETIVVAKVIASGSKAHFEIPLSVPKRRATNRYSEFIYVWRKSSCTN